MRRYNPSEVEPKWQKIWADDQRYKAPDSSKKPKYYVTGMFPYPSGAGMHTGHFFEHSIVDGEARFRRALGYNVMYPMGFDNFGLPAENYAIKTGVSPQKATADNIANFKKQLNRVGASIDWSREVQTSDPSYYKWTQWVFTKLFERGLAYQKEAQQWWCEIDQTVLANEQVVNGKCWRHDGPNDPPAIKKSIKQWFFKITDYADALLEEIPALNWPDKIKVAQENWIGKSEGAEIKFRVENHDNTITVFSTRPDTIFGATFLVLAPEHPLARQLVNDDTSETVSAYIDEAIKKSEVDRQAEGKDKTGVFTGSYAINPASGEKMPIWIADYVLGGYGTGAIMAVPAHDERDFEFAERYGLPIVQTVVPRLLDQANPPRPDKENTTRNVVMCIIEHPSDGTFLTLRWNTQNWHNFVMGGIEDGETAEEAGRREIMEETGYTDFSYVDALPLAMKSVFYAAHKDVNRDINTTVLRFKLNSLDQVETAKESHEDFVSEWTPKSELHALQPVAELNYILSWLKGERVLFTGEGVLINSGAFDGRESSDAREEIVAWFEEQGTGRMKTTYKMRDWLISRQRYWGAPIPIIHCDEHGAVAVPASDLPVILPEVEDYAPKGDGKSPLARQTDWVNTVCPTCGKPAKRETDVMDGYACSSWYLLRYTDPHDAEQAWKPELASYWTPLDMYVGGDHAVAHLLYVRFWNHVFYDMGLVPTKEPVGQLVYHGYINAEDGTKMSKSKGNVVDPLEVIDAGYGADALRTFELFLGPINENSSWSSTGIAGVYRFLNRLWTLVQEYDVSDKTAEVDVKKLDNIIHVTIKKVTNDLRRLSFNTAIAAQMECVNELYKLKLDGFSSEWKPALESLIKLAQPFAPHLAAELWQQLGNDSQLDFESWPEWDEAKIVSGDITIAVQVNGKLRAEITVASGALEEAVTAAALAAENVVKFLDGQEPKKIIYVPGKLVSIVT
jgi:leucyl-tRNA synthetase